MGFFIHKFISFIYIFLFLLMYLSCLLKGNKCFWNIKYFGEKLIFFDFLHFFLSLLKYISYFIYVKGYKIFCEIKIF